MSKQKWYACWAIYKMCTFAKEKLVWNEKERSKIGEENRESVDVTFFLSK